MSIMGLVEHSSRAPTRLVPSLAAVVKAWWEAYLAGSRRRATVRVLQGLSDRTLRDIGIHRSEITSVAAARDDDRWPRRCAATPTILPPC